MTQTTLKKLFWIPIAIIGVALMIMGPRWMIVEEPWLLDKVANEELIEMSFDQLLTAPINATLPEYLRTIYRFFGLWVTAIGILLLSQLKFSDLKQQVARNALHVIVGFILISGLYFGHTRIPSSPFIYLMWFFVCIYLISGFASWRLSRIK